jgi:hypothetical protein
MGRWAQFSSGSEYKFNGGQSSDQMTTFGGKHYFEIDFDYWQGIIDDIPEEDEEDIEHELEGLEAAKALPSPKLSYEEWAEFDREYSCYGEWVQDWDGVTYEDVLGQLTTLIAEHPTLYKGDLDAHIRSFPMDVDGNRSLWLSRDRLARPCEDEELQHSYLVDLGCVIAHQLLWNAHLSSNYEC